MPSSPVAVLASPDPPAQAEGASGLPVGDRRLAALPEHLTPLRLLGQGGSSIVYEALHTRLQVKVALKLLTIDGPHAEQAQKRMLREANLYALLDDPRIPRVYDVNELPDGTPYVVMEMVPGASLEDLLAARGALPAPHAIAIAREVLSALASVHERGVLHRDVKPANVILTYDARGPSEVRLVDFGIAKMFTRGGGEEAVTQRGTLIGTPHYMAAECLSGHPANTSTDVYSVGVMLYEMLAGAVPFSGASLPLIMAAVMREEPKSFAEHGVDVPPELSRLVLKAMAREPSDRFASARDMLLALQPERATSVPSGTRKRNRRRGKFWFLAALLAMLLVSVGFLLAGERVALRAEKAPAAAPAAQAFESAPAVPAGSPLAPDLARHSQKALLPPAEQPSNREQHPRRARTESRRNEPGASSKINVDQALMLPANPY